MKQEKENSVVKPATYENEGERIRFENYERQRAELLRQGYKEHIGIISVVKANVLAFVTAGPFALLVIIAYMMIWKQGTFVAEGSRFLLWLVLIFVSIPIHEGLHGLTWGFFCKGKWKSIYLGFIAKYLTPFCHCMEPLSFGPYILGGLMPFFVLGIGVSVVGIVCQSMLITLVGVINILSAGGDTTIACILLKYKKALILDHPKECGFIAFTK